MFSDERGKPITVNRKPPINLKPTDLPLFEGAFTTYVHEPMILQLEKANVFKDQIFTLRPLKFYSRFTNLFAVKRSTHLKRLVYFFKRSERLKRGIWVTDEWSVEYFHWLTDALSRWEAAARTDNKAALILPARYADKSYIHETLRLLNVPVCFYNPGKRLLVDELILPAHLAVTGNYNVSIINSLRARFLKGYNVPPDKKVYVSRSKASKRKVVNENEIIPILQQYGFEIHCLEDYSLQQQIDLLKQTKILAGLHGAGLTNMIFMQAGGSVLEFRNTQDKANNCFFSLASALDHGFFYLPPPGNGNLYPVDVSIDVGLLRETLDLMAESNGY
ncbi:Protein of unknown function [Chitinophaga rupis]|uniref:Glycosyltransferase 61 catalytic domain-containing protein n=1 Tax=Chitinophaga rupis TaxID=573321 RepID=A0A1H7XBI9_9BACT|nr:glycosyltransferase family 61 protein [Chitinophaga rupis]SEM31262.1 Protein of unknown function [Chitinophaga rupis]